MSDQLAIDFNKRPSRGRVSYYNTTSLAGDVLATAKSEARKQDVLVLGIMRGARRPMGPSEVWKAGVEAGSDWLLTSVRRSIHTLTADGRLRKLDDYHLGPHGRPERLWVASEGLAGEREGIAGSAGE